MKASERVRAVLVHALTEYDRKQSRKRGYNPHALGIYFQRLDDICADIDAGADVRAAIVAGFSDRLVDSCLRALKLPITTNDEALYGAMVYTPVKSKGE